MHPCFKGAISKHLADFSLFLGFKSQQKGNIEVFFLDYTKQSKKILQTGTPLSLLSAIYPLVNSK